MVSTVEYILFEATKFLVNSNPYDIVSFFISN